MSKIKLASTPIGVLLIASFYILGAIVLVVLRFTNPEQAAVVIAERHGLPASTGSWILPMVAGIGLLIAFGLLSLSRWGFFLAIAYLLHFGTVNLYMSNAAWVTVNCGNSIWSSLVIGYLILVRKRFFTEGKVIETQLQQ